MRRTRATAWQIGAALAVPRSTVTRVLARCGLNRVAACGPPAPVTRAAFLRRAIRWYGRAGLRIRRLLTDNGFAYRARVFAQACRARAIRHRFTRPYHPQTNGKAERLIQTLLREWRIEPLPQLGAAHRCLTALSALLQPPASACEPRSALAVDAFPRGCLR